MTGQNQHKKNDGKAADMFDTFVSSIELSRNNRLKALQFLIRMTEIEKKGEDAQHVFQTV